MSDVNESISTRRSSQIKSVYEKGYWWVDIPDEMWHKRTYHTYIAGMDVT